MADNNGLLSTIIEMLLSLFIKKDVTGPEVPKKAEPIQTVELPPVVAPIQKEPEINWLNPDCKISKRFTVHDALYLNSWKTYHIPSESEKVSILELAKKVDIAIDLLEKELGVTNLTPKVHAWIRPNKANCPGTEWNGKSYNKFIYETQVWVNLTPEEKAKKTVPNSPHIDGKAVDYHIIGFEGKLGCAKLRLILVPKLAELGIRMEDIDGGWIHNDTKPVIHSAFFKP